MEDPHGGWCRFEEPSHSLALVEASAGVGRLVNVSVRSVVIIASRNADLAVANHATRLRLAEDEDAIGIDTLESDWI